MATIGQYEIIEKLSEGRNRTVYRAKNIANDRRFILKVLNSEYSDPMEVYKLKHEYEILNDFKSPHIVQAFKVEKIDNLHALVVEDFGAISLKKYLKKTQLDTLQFLAIANNVVNAMITVHENEIIHKDVNPSNILINERNLEVKMSDFGISERFSKNTTSISKPNDIIGTFEYLPPEQSGRINKSVDFRSDIYSLGITYYEMATGQLPFVSDDVIEMIHAHIAVVPTTPHDLNPEIPVQISSIIMRMIEKSPDDRYQSLAAVKEDIVECIDLFENNGYIEKFELGRKEKNHRFIIPDTLYGRKALVERIEKSLERIKTSSNEAMFIHGEFGSGKSYILKHFENQLVNENFNILYSCCEDDHMNDPYYVIKEAFRGYVKKILSGSDDLIEEFKESAEVELGPSIKILADMIPELKNVFNQMIEPQLLNPFEAANRIKNLMRGFIRLMSRDEFPTIMILDDLHKADFGTFEVLDYILDDKSLKRVFIIGAFEETPPISDYLTTFLSKKKNGLDFETVRVPLFKIGDINELTKNMFELTSLENGVIGNIIFQKTNGNPYFVFEMLKDCYKRGDIYFDREMGIWHFNRDQLQAYAVYDNVVSTVLKKVSSISEETQEMLSYAACIGIEFDIRILLTITDIPLEMIKECIREALENQLIYSNDRRAQYLQYVEDEPIYFRFIHEKVRVSLFDRLLPEHQVQLSYEIGQYSIEKLGSIDEIQMDVVDHLNFARTLIKNREERRNLAKYNYIIGLRSKNVNSYDIASKYLTSALELIDDQLFEQDYTFYYDLYLLKAEAEYLNKNFETAELYFDHLIQLISEPLDTGKVLKTKMVLYINQGKVHDAFAIAKEALKPLGLDINVNPGLGLVCKELISFKMNSAIKKPDDLLELPMMQDPNRIMIMEILMTLISVTYLVSRNLFIYVIMKMLNYSIRYGHSEVSPYAYSIYGLIEGVAFRNPEIGLEYGQVGLKLANQFGNYEILNKCHFSVGFFLNHWVNHSSDNVQYLKKAIQNGYYAGDMVFFTYSVAAYVLTLLEMGENLDYILEEIDEYFDSIRGMKVDDVFNLIQAIKQYILCLKSKTHDYTCFTSDDFDEIEFEERLKSSSMLSIYAVYKVLQIQLKYMFGNYKEAVDLSVEMKPLFNELMGLMPYANLKFYQTLALLKLIEEKEGNTFQQKIIVKNNIRKLKKWMRHAPANFSHKYYLVKAENLRLKKQYVKAEKHYLDAIRYAQRFRYKQDEAIACELLANHYQQMSNQRVRNVYLKDAYYAYSNWGALAKKNHLKKNHPEIVFEDGARTHTDKTSTTTATSGSNGLRFDYLTIIKSSQTLSAEIVLEELLRKLISIILENAGADHVVLMMKQDQMNIEAVGSTSDVIKVLNKTPVKGSGIVPESIVNYVMRTGNVFITDDIRSEARLNTDMYFNYHNPKSILCLPVFNKGMIYGVLYLENNLIDGAFRENGIEVLNLLTAQFAFSYENAQLYRNLTLSESELKLHKENLEMLVEERTQELSYANSQIQNLLDNAGQGFLSFDQNGLISNEYSKECYKIFKKDLSGLSFSSLIGHFISNDEKVLIDRIIEKIFQAHNDFESNVYLSLLPKEVNIHTRIVSIEYRHIRDLFEKKVMAILTDITDTKALELAREEEKRNLKMIVKAVKYQNNFRKSLEDYVQFYTTDIFEIFSEHCNVRQSMLEFYRLAHTFKGDFAQWSMTHTERALHDLESLIHMKLGHLDLDYEEVREFIEEIDFEGMIEKDINIVKEYVGVSFLQSTEKLEIEKSLIVELEQRLNAVTELAELKPIIYEVRKSRFTNFKDVLHQFDEYLKNLALGLDKKINDIIIIGDDVFVDKTHYYPFIRAINHIFRNMVDYGIETPNERINLGKDEMGSIICRIELMLNSQFKLIIRDDGNGISVPKIKRALIEQELFTERELNQMSHHDLIQYVFTDQISTKGEQTQISGRGVGLAAVKKEISKLNGEIVVYSEDQVGTSFEIVLPILND